MVIGEIEKSRTTTADALMGLLSLGPMSGYQIRKLIEASIGNFWSESYGQIYPTLKKLAAEGMVSLSKEQTDVGAERKIYALTETGRERLQSWLALPAREQPPRNELLLKIFFGSRISPDVLIQHIESFRAVQQGKLQRYLITEQTLKRDHGKHPELAYWLITLNYGLHETRAFITWCDEALAQCHGLKERNNPRTMNNARKTAKKT